ncbi:PAS domain S-box protein [candidate division KSB1 bacterium]|nr:PAS domain S-box protein [candidate division KSB1 bacterium]
MNIFRNETIAEMAKEIAMLRKRLRKFEKAKSSYTRVKAKLRKSQRYIDTILLNMPAGLAILEGPEFRYFRINKTLADINGLPVEDHLGKRLAEVLPDAAQDILPRLLEVLETGKPAPNHEFSTRLPKDLDQIRWFIYSFFPVMGEDGKSIAVGVVVLDITERKQAEAALQLSKAKYRQLVEQLPLGIYQSTKEGKFITVNSAMVEMLGYESAEELLRTNIVKDLYFTLKERHKVLRKYREDRSAIVSYRLKKKDGAELWVEDQGVLAFDYCQGKDFFQGVLLNITERKEAEDIKSVLFQISEATSVSSNLEELLKIICQKVGLLIDTTNFYVALYDAENDRYSFPYCVDEHEESRKFAQQHLRKSLKDYVRRTGIPLLANEEVHRQLIQKGEVELVGTPSAQWLGAPLKTAHSVIGVVVVQSYTNPTLYSEKDLGLMTFVSEQIALAIERKLAEEQLSMLSRAVEQSPVGVIITDTQGNIEYVNPKYTQVSGYTSEEVIGRKPSILKSGKTPEEYKKVWETITTGGEWRGEFQNKKKNGEPYRESLSITAVKNSAGATRHFLIVLEDITARMQAEEKRKQLEEQLRQAQKMETLGTLAGGIAHDFNNILQAIRGYADMSMDEVPPKSQAHADLQEVMKATNRGKKIVQKILAFSRREAHEPRPLRIHPIVREALNLLRATLPTTIDLRQELKRECGTVLGDSGQIHQVVMNLCTNSFQAMRKNGGVLMVSLEKVVSDDEFLQSHPKLNEQEYVQLTVSDTGEGMDQTTMARIFEPFFTTKNRGEGTGLGLSVVHGIVTSHKGDIIVESEPGQGTTFRVYFPVIESAAEKARKSDGKIAGGHERVLLVDDDRVVISVIKRLLDRSGYDVTTRSGGVESLETFRAHPDDFDLVITDQTMPKMTGMKLAGELLNIRPDLPIILISGFGDEVTEKSARARGIKEFILKPVSREDLSKAVRRVIDEKQER